MGYTHYFGLQNTDQRKFEKVAADCMKVCEASGVRIFFENDEVQPPKFEKGEIRFNGAGEDGHEPFILRPGETGKLCKTAEKPYDLCVASCLIVLKHHFRKDFNVHSDGENEDFAKARALCQKTLGYGEEFVLDTD